MFIEQRLPVFAIFYLVLYTIPHLIQHISLILWQKIELILARNRSEITGERDSMKPPLHKQAAFSRPTSFSIQQSPQHVVWILIGVFITPHMNFWLLRGPHSTLIASTHRPQLQHSVSSAGRGRRVSRQNFIHKLSASAAQCPGRGTPSAIASIHTRLTGWEWSTTVTELRNQLIARRI